MAYDGSTIRHNTKNSEINIENPRLSVCILTQPSTVLPMLRPENLLVHNGFFPRFLIAEAPSRKHLRQHYNQHYSDYHIQRFNEKVKDFLHHTYSGPSADANHLTLQLSEEAKNTYNQFLEAIQKDLNGSLKNIATYAEKIKISVCRIAAILQRFSDPNITVISKEMMDCAINLGYFFLEEIEHIYYQQEQDEMAENVCTLERYIIKHYQKGTLPTKQITTCLFPPISLTIFDAGAMLHNVPPKLRKRIVLDKCLEVLDKKGVISLYRESGGQPAKTEKNHYVGFIVNIPMPNNSCGGMPVNSYSNTPSQQQYFPNNYQYNSLFNNSYRSLLVNSYSNTPSQQQISNSSNEQSQYSLSEEEINNLL